MPRHKVLNRPPDQCTTLFSDNKLLTQKAWVPHLYHKLDSVLPHILQLVISCLRDVVLCLHKLLQPLDRNHQRPMDLGASFPGPKTVFKLYRRLGSQTLLLQRGHPELVMVEGRLFSYFECYCYTYVLCGWRDNNRLSDGMRCSDCR